MRVLRSLMTLLEKPATNRYPLRRVSHRGGSWYGTYGPGGEEEVLGNQLRQCQELEASETESWKL